MRPQPLATDSVAPTQVWEGLTPEAQAGAIRLMALLASNLVFQGFGSTHREIAACLHDTVPPRSGPSISTATL
jgi:hypothetical protein